VLGGDEKPSLCRHLHIIAGLARARLWSAETFARILAALQIRIGAFSFSEARQWNFLFTSK
jgi:hypothetical protein